MLSMLCMPRISKYLMQNRGFNIILCESDWTFMWHVNQYVHRSLSQTGLVGGLSCGFVCRCHPMFSPTYPRKKSKMFPDTTRFPASWRMETNDFRGLFCCVRLCHLSEASRSGLQHKDWMWQNRPFYELVEWMRKRASSDGPYVFGMDCYCKEEAKEEVLNFFDFYDRDKLGKDRDGRGL